MPSGVFDAGHPGRPGQSHRWCAPCANPLPARQRRRAGLPTFAAGRRRRRGRWEPMSAPTGGGQSRRRCGSGPRRCGGPGPGSARDHGRGGVGRRCGGRGPNVLKLMDALEDRDDAHTVHHNFGIPDEVMQQVGQPGLHVQGGYRLQYLRPVKSLEQARQPIERLYCPPQRRGGECARGQQVERGLHRRGRGVSGGDHR